MARAQVPSKKYYLMMLAISCVMLGVFTCVVYTQSKNNNIYNDKIVQSHETLYHARLLMFKALDLAEMSASDIYGTSPPKRQIDEAGINSEVAALQAIGADEPERSTQLADLIATLDQIKLVVGNHLHAQDKKLTSVYSLQSDDAAIKQALANVRASFLTFSSNEQKLIATYKTAADSLHDRYLSTILFSGLLGLVALAASNLFIFTLMNKSARAEDKLRKTEEMFSLALANINDGYYNYDIIKDVMSYSDTYMAIIGYHPKEMGTKQKEFVTLIHPDDWRLVNEVLTNYKDDKIKSHSSIFRVRHKDGRWVWVLSRGVGISDDTGRTIRIIGAHTDITLQKRREEELQFFMQENEVQRQELAKAKDIAEAANQAKTDFLVTMSHEIRTPLNVVIGLARLLAKTPLNNKQKEMSETLGVNADMLLRLVNDLLDLSRVEAGHVELESRIFSFEEMLTTLRAMFETQMVANNLALTITNNAGNQPFVGAPLRIQQILVNLVGNALKFTADGGIAVTVDYITRQKDDCVLSIVVKDTGVGIEPEKLSTIFSKFVQADRSIERRFGGSGLGLSICLSLANLMGGDIKVASEPGEGSTFTLTLPLQYAVAKKPKQQRLPPAPQKSVPSKGTVLVVEDYAANILVATMILEELGCDTDVAKCGEEALHKIKNRDEPYTAILMDVQMSDMNGYEVTRAIREMEKLNGSSRSYIIGATAHALAGDRELCIEAGMDEYITKPIQPDLLSELLDQVSVAA